MAVVTARPDHSSDLSTIVRGRLVDGDFDNLALQARIRRIAAEEAAFTHDDLAEFAGTVEASMIGLGPLEYLRSDPTVSEIMVNGPNDVFVERHGKIERVAVAFASDSEVLELIERVVGPLGLRIDESSPIVDARLSDGSRFNAVIPPIATCGPTCNIRRFVLECNDFDEMVRRGFCPRSLVELLGERVRDRNSILISGGTSTGKTTFLNVLSSAIPPGERLITIEDAAELRLGQPHVVGLEARPASTEGTGELTVRDLVRNALRMRPDRIIVGEVRGGEAMDMLTAMSTGHDGSLCTIHANGPHEALRRLELMILTAEPALPARVIRSQIASSIDLIIQLGRDPDGGRRLYEVCEVHDLDGEIALETLYELERSDAGEVVERHDG